MVTSAKRYAWDVPKLITGKGTKTLGPDMTDYFGWIWIPKCMRDR